MTETDSKNGTPMAHGGSRVVRYELIDKYGRIHSTWAKAEAAAIWAGYHWPYQEQDPERTGSGWDIQIAGAK